MITVYLLNIHQIYLIDFITGELYPFRVRSTATGITMGLNYVLLFCANKTLVNIEDLIGLPAALGNNILSYFPIENE